MSEDPLMKEAKASVELSLKKPVKAQCHCASGGKCKQGWQPIETAPKDGIDVLLFEDGKQYVASWSETAGGQFFNDAEHQHNPTHWMPLPKPPTA